MHTPPCVRQAASRKLLHGTGSSAQRSETISRGRMGQGREGGLSGRDTYTWLIHGVIQQKLTLHCNYPPVFFFLKDPVLKIFFI